MREFIDQLDVPDPWDRMQFVENVAEARGRAISLVPVHTSILADSPCGLWLIREHDDIVMFEEGTSEYHVDQIILHELGHMILGHDKSAGTSGEALMITSMTPHLDPATVKAALGRRDYCVEQEYDAEMFASVVLAGLHEKKTRVRPFQQVFHGGKP